MTMTSATSGALNTAAYSLGSAQDLSGNQITVSSCNAVDDKNVASTVSVTCALSGVIAAGTYTVSIGSGSNVPADLTGNQITPAPTSVTVTYK
jgi:hypothetical protein